jgi:nitrite reductase/ring-hydroxylating ferredoxin subunit
MAKVYIGKSKDFAKGINVVYVYGNRICLIKKEENEFYALFDVCPHANCALSTGILKGYSIMCACHAAVFDIKTGEVIANPLTGEKIKTATAFKADVNKEDVYINL